MINPRTGMEYTLDELNAGISQMQPDASGYAINTRPQPVGMFGNSVPAPQPMPEQAPQTKKGFFSKDGAWRDVLGGLSDFVGVAAGGKPIYLANKLEQQKTEREQAYELEKARQTALWKQQYGDGDLTSAQKELAQAYGYGTPEYLAKLQQIYDVRANPMVQYTSYVGGQPTLNVVPRSQLLNTQQPSGTVKYTQIAADKNGKPVYLINGEWYDNPEGL